MKNLIHKVCRVCGIGASLEGQRQNGRWTCPVCLKEGTPYRSWKLLRQGKHPLQRK